MDENPFLSKYEESLIVGSQKSSKIELDFLELQDQVTLPNSEPGFGHILVASWNVEQYIPKVLDAADDLLDLSDWFKSKADGTCVPDMVVVGLQEVHNPVYTWLPMAYTAGSESGDEFVLNRITRECLPPHTFLKHMDCYLRRRWLPHILVSLEKVFGDNSEKLPATFSFYPIIVSKDIGRGIIVLLRCSDSVAFGARDLHVGASGSGLLGIYGNKGALCCGIQLTCHEKSSGKGWGLKRRASAAPVALDKSNEKESKISIAFMNVHLGAHFGYQSYLNRNDELKYLLQTSVLWPYNSSMFQKTGLNFIANATGGSAGESKTYSTVADYDMLLLFGDTNYRLSAYSPSLAYQLNEHDPVRLSFLAHENNAPEQWAWIHERIQQRNIEDLLKIDECRRERIAVDGVLSKFSEAPIAFLPTYKFIRDPQGRLFRSETPYVPVPGSVPLPFKKHESLISSEAKPTGVSSALEAHVSLAELRVGSQQSLKKIDSSADLAASGKANSTLRYSDRRLPAYCDRILYFNRLSQSASRYNLHQTANEDASKSLEAFGYNMASEISCSDHKPIRLFLKLNLPVLLHRKLYRLTVDTARNDTATESSDAPFSLGSALVPSRMIWQIRCHCAKRFFVSNQLLIYLFLILLLCMLWIYS